MSYNDKLADKCVHAGNHERIDERSEKAVGQQGKRHRDHDGEGKNVPNLGTRRVILHLRGMHGTLLVEERRQNVPGAELLRPAPKLLFAKTKDQEAEHFSPKDRQIDQKFQY